MEPTGRERSQALFATARDAEARLTASLRDAHQALLEALGALEEEREVRAACAADGRPYVASAAEHLEIRLTEAQQPIEAALNAWGAD